MHTTTKKTFVAQTGNRSISCVGTHSRSRGGECEVFSSRIAPTQEGEDFPAKTFADQPASVAPHQCPHFNPLSTCCPPIRADTETAATVMGQTSVWRQGFIFIAGVSRSPGPRRRAGGLPQYLHSKGRDIEIYPPPKSPSLSSRQTRSLTERISAYK